ncbi:MAG: NAD(P) transhydrogenase subunit alpha [Puniceicoccales bacterium]|nr:NAD(P) transhydrogenase subunit alpha [Puniceicoccales bacterium]
MQTIFCPKETSSGENRAATVPKVVAKFCSLGLSVLVEKAIGKKIGIADDEYFSAGANVVDGFRAGASEADVVIGVKCPAHEKIVKIKRGATHISFLDRNIHHAEVEAFTSAGVSMISLGMIPRIAVAQKFDALSSQASLAGYAAVLMAATHTSTAFPMMMTPAGTIHPANVFVVGIGVAGLQAIATAKRLGARVEAFDPRPETEEQARSLGAKFLKIEIGETRQTKQGYARELTEEQIQKQRLAMISACNRADVVITTAKVFGGKAPILVTKEMLDEIDTKTLFVDMAVAAGGNVEGSVGGKLTICNGHIKVLGISEAEQLVAYTASQVFAENMYNFVEHFYDRETKRIIFSPTDAIISKCLLKI